MRASCYPASCCPDRPTMQHIVRPSVRCTWGSTRCGHPGIWMRFMPPALPTFPTSSHIGLCPTVSSSYADLQQGTFSIDNHSVHPHFPALRLTYHPREKEHISHLSECKNCSNNSGVVGSQRLDHNVCQKRSPHPTQQAASEPAKPPALHTRFRIRSW